MRGIIVLALRKPAYLAAAFNLALSIKHYNPSLPITLLSDATHPGVYRAEHYAVFDQVTTIAEDDCTDDGRFCPGKAKLSLHKYANFDQALYVDADSVCCRNLDPLFERLLGQPFKSQRIRNYSQWTDAEYFRSFFGVEPGQTINSSWIYFENDTVFRRAAQYYAKKFPLDQLNQNWGASLPDELFFNAALESLGVDSRSDVPVMYFDFSDDPRSIPEVIASHFFVTFYGNAGSTRPLLRQWYDEYLAGLCKLKGIEHRFKMDDIVAHKHVGA